MGEKKLMFNLVNFDNCGFGPGKSCNSYSTESCLVCVFIRLQLLGKGK